MKIAGRIKIANQESCQAEEDQQEPGPLAALLFLSF